MKKTRVGSLMYHLKCFHFPCAKMQEEEEVKHREALKVERKPGGWKSMPYVIGNETFEKVATTGLLANFMVYLLTQYHMKQVSATNVINIWFGTTNVAPLLGAFISDAYLGRFQTLAYSSIASLLGMATFTLTALLPELRPPECNSLQGPCTGPSWTQLGVLYLALGLLTLGAAGIRPCSLPFGVDQFDPTTEKGRKGIDSFFNWYYFTFTIAMMISLTLIVYIQDSVSWALGLGIPTFLMLCSVILFFVGTRIYVHVPPGGSIFSDLAQVLVAAYRKRRSSLPPFDEQQRVLYNPPPKLSFITRLPLTPHFSLLNKAAIIEDTSEVGPDGAPTNPWCLCSIQQIEELKCLVRIAPIWASGIICFTSVVQQSTFIVSQAMAMDRHLGPHFKVPPGSLTIFSMLTITLWIPIYDRVLIPASRRLTKQPGGISLLQRMGIGMFISIISMVVAGLVEAKRRRSALSHHLPSGAAPISAMWLAPQLVLLGLAEAFNGIGQIEFYYKQFPEHMRSIAGSLFFCAIAGASYLSSFIVSIVHHHTKPNWLTDDVNAGKLDYFYYLIAALGALNLVYFIACARCYHYKTDDAQGEQDVKILVELNSSKSAEK